MNGVFQLKIHYNPSCHFVLQKITEQYQFRDQVLNVLIYKYIQTKNFGLF